MEKIMEEMIVAADIENEIERDISFNVDFLDPKIDLVFKAIYSNQNSWYSKTLLIHLLNMVLERKEDLIKEVFYENPFSINEDVKEKVIIFDVKVTTGSGEHIAIEMQMAPYKAFPMRISYYDSKLISNSLERGEKYVKIKKTITISFLNGIQYPQTERIHTSFIMKEELENFPMLIDGGSRVHYVELGKIDLTKPVADMTELERYCMLLIILGKKDFRGKELFAETLGSDSNHESDSDNISMERPNNKAEIRKVRRNAKIRELIEHDKGGFIEMTVKALEQISSDKKMRDLALSREMALIDEAFRHQEAMEEDLSKGMRQGEDKMSTLINKLNESNRIEDIVKAANDYTYRQQLFKELGIE